MNRTRQLAWLFLPLAILFTPLAHPAEEAPLVLTSLAPLYELTRPLLEDTDIQLRLLPESPRSMQSHASLFVRQADQFAEEFARADAVLSLGSVWAADPFYTSAREFNIRVVPIDAGKPWSHDRDGVALANSPTDGSPLLPVWLSLGNVMRIIDIVGRDLQALYPQHASTIQANQERSRQQWTSLKTHTEVALLDLADPQIFALADEFAYLSRDLGLFVAGYFVKQDIDWTDADYRQLTETLKASGVSVVVHKWEPSQEIQEAISAAGARLVVLDTLETSLRFQDDFRQNLDRLLSALEGV